MREGLILEGSRSSQRWWQVVQVSLLVLPFLNYGSFVALSLTLIYLIAQFKRSAIPPRLRNSLIAVSGWMIVSAVLAINQGEAFLQLSNFFPLFLLFGLFPFLLHTTERLEQAAWMLVLGSLPINIISVFEYILKAPWIPRDIRRIPFVKWVRSAPHAGRAMVRFDHPNWLASYLVLMLGLGLGLVLLHWREQRTSRETPSSVSFFSRHHATLLYAATFLNLVGIFCSGSRNGLLVAMMQLVIFSLFVKQSRWLLMAVIGGVVALVGGGIFLGIGGRSLDPTTWANDPRLRIWGIALQMIQERPWFGWGLGNFKFEYPNRLLRTYPSCFPQRQLEVIPVECADVTHAHNVWLLWSAEAGIPVAIALTLISGYLCYRGVKALLFQRIDPLEQALLLGYLLSFGGCVAFALFDVTYYDARINIVNWLVLTGIYALGSRDL